LGGCGQNTLAADRDQLAELRSHRNLPPENQATVTPLHYWLLDKEAVYHLKVGLNTIGRMPDNDVAILDSSVSRRHCAIVIHASRGCELYDTASKNGTFVNGQRVSAPTSLKAGDEIRLCDRQLVFLSDSRGQPPAPPEDDANERTHVED
jgi:pSer/pThr/pTyr-binding forkhead associated (FHA) protein